MKVSKDIQNKMHQLAKITQKARILSMEINDYFENKGYEFI